MGDIQSGEFMRRQAIIALDVGTTNIKCIVFDQEAKMISNMSRNVDFLSNRTDRIEYDPTVIWETVKDLLGRSLQQEDYAIDDVLSIGISTQRGSTLLWNRESGLPECNAISWQDIRTADICKKIMNTELGSLLMERQGGPLIPGKSLGRLLWLFENINGLREKAEQGLLLFGNIDSWVLWKLTGKRIHATDNSNASSTHMVEIGSQQWDTDLISRLEIPLETLPEIRPSSGFLGLTDPSLFGREIPICSLVADQQGSLFGQICLHRGMTKCTYGTGTFVLMNIGEEPVTSAKAAWNLDGQTTYMLEGYSGATGLMTEWMFKEVMGDQDVSKSEKMALEVEGSQGVVVVPAFSGLQAPFHDPHAVGMILGLTVGVRKNHIIRAILESIGMICRSIIDHLQEVSNIQIDRLYVDGAGADNNFLVQFQSDILGIPVEKSALTESSALGAAFLAGLASGFWRRDEIAGFWRSGGVFEPRMDETRRNRLYDRWLEAARFSMAWGKGAGSPPYPVPKDHGKGDFSTIPKSLT